MRYKVIIESCKDPARAQQIALEVAQYSGFLATTIYDALLDKLICVKSNTDEREALYLKERFENAGASVRLVTISNESILSNGDYDDDEEDEAGRVRSDEEYIEQLKKRGDIFFIEKDMPLRKIEAVCLIIAICVGAWLSAQQVAQLVHADFYEKDPFTKTIQAKPLQVIENSLINQEINTKTEKASLKPKEGNGKGGKNSGGGDPFARVTRRGVLGIISGKIKGKTVASADIFSKGGFEKGIDAILQGVGALKSGGGGGSGRKGLAGIGFGLGVGSGTDDGSSGIDGFLKKLMKSDASSIKLKRRDVKILIPRDDITLKTGGGSIRDGRNRASIMRVVMQNLSALRYAYNKRLREKPGLTGRITCKFAIDEFGKVLFCKIESSSMNDTVLEKEIVNKIRRWAFEKIDKPGDVTEVVYPFVFTS